jgi:hypothetical protein
MEQQRAIDDAFDVGAWVGRRQAFALVAGRCSAADAEILFEIREKKLFRTIEPAWEEFCVKRLGLTRSYVDRIIRQFKELGPNYCKLSSFTRIKPAEYRLISAAVSDDGLAYGGEVIALEPENAPIPAAARHEPGWRWTGEAPDRARQRPASVGPDSGRGVSSAGLPACPYWLSRTVAQAWRPALLGYELDLPLHQAGHDRKQKASGESAHQHAGDTFHGAQVPPPRRQNQISVANRGIAGC